MNFIIHTQRNNKTYAIEYRSGQSTLTYIDLIFYKYKYITKKKKNEKFIAFYAQWKCILFQIFFKFL